MKYLGNDYKYMVLKGSIVEVGFRNGSELEIISAPLEKNFYGKTRLLNSELPALDDRCMLDDKDVFIYCKKDDMIFLPSKD